MAKSADQIEVYLETGKKRVFAGAVEWPGWSRAAKDEDSALQALIDYAPRYAKVLKAADIEFDAPADVSGLKVVERLKGSATTDFGAPDGSPDADKRAIDDRELARFEALLNAYWRAFDKAVKQAEGKELRKGARGGGRELEGVVEHVVESALGYLSALGWKEKADDAADLSAVLARTQQFVLNGLKAAAHGEIAERGPRGGVRWVPRYFVRRLSWHVLDHVWEIEDRVE